MYEFPKDLDLSFFKNIELCTLSFSKVSIRMIFNNDISLSIESDFEFDSEKLTLEDGYKLHVLIGKKILNASNKGNDLILNFEGGHRLVLLDDGSEYYQSYHFYTPRGLVVI